MAEYWPLTTSQKEWDNGKNLMKKYRCALCDFTFPESSLSQCCTLQRIIEIKVHIGAPCEHLIKRSAAVKYELVRLCLFCEQFKDPEVSGPTKGTNLLKDVNLYASAFAETSPRTMEKKPSFKSVVSSSALERRNSKIVQDIEESIRKSKLQSVVGGNRDEMLLLLKEESEEEEEGGDIKDMRRRKDRKSKSSFTTKSTNVSTAERIIDDVDIEFHRLKIRNDYTSLTLPAIKHLVNSESSSITTNNIFKGNRGSTSSTAECSTLVAKPKKFTPNELKMVEKARKRHEALERKKINEQIRLQHKQRLKELRQKESEEEHRVELRKRYKDIQALRSFDADLDALSDGARLFWKSRMQYGVNNGSGSGGGSCNDENEDSNNKRGELKEDIEMLVNNGTDIDDHYESEVDEDELIRLAEAALQGNQRVNYDNASSFIKEKVFDESVFDEKARAKRSSVDKIDKNMVDKSTLTPQMYTSDHEDDDNGGDIDDYYHDQKLVKMSIRYPRVGTKLKVISTASPESTPSSCNAAAIEPDPCNTKSTVIHVQPSIGGFVDRNSNAVKQRNGNIREGEHVALKPHEAIKSIARETDKHHHHHQDIPASIHAGNVPINKSITKSGLLNKVSIFKSENSDSLSHKPVNNINIDQYQRVFEGGDLAQDIENKALAFSANSFAYTIDEGAYSVKKVTNSSARSSKGITDAPRRVVKIVDTTPSSPNEFEYKTTASTLKHKHRPHDGDEEGYTITTINNPPSKKKKSVKGFVESKSTPALLTSSKSESTRHILGDTGGFHNQSKKFIEKNYFKSHKNSTEIVGTSGNDLVFLPFLNCG